MATEYVISIKVQGSESASGPLGAVGGALGRIAEFVSAGIIFRGLEDIGRGLEGAAEAGWTAANAFETVMSRIKGLTTTPEADLSKMSEDIIKLSKDMNISATELGQAEYFIASSGYAGKQATDILTASAKAASAGLGQTKTIADAVTSALNAYKLKAGDAAHITDVLTRAVVEGKGEPDQLAGALGRVLPIAAAVGVNFEQVMASMATMTRTGLSADEAATALRGTLAALFAPGKQAKGALEEIGWSADGVRQAIREKGLNAALAELMDRTHGNVETLDLIIPNIRALIGVLGTASSQGDAYAKILASMGDATGSVDKAFAASAGTWEFQWDRLKNVLLSMPIELGEKVLPGLTGILDAVTKDITGKTSGWADLVAGWLGPVIGRLQAAAETGGIQGVMAEIGRLINEGWTLHVVPQLKKWETAFWDWVTGATGAQQGVPGVLSKLTDAISNFIMNDWPKIKDKLDAWGGKFFDWVSTVVVPQVKEKMNLIADGLKKWADDPVNQARMAALGTATGKAIADGLHILVKATEFWAPIMADMATAMAGALAKVMTSSDINGKFWDAFVKGILEGMGIKGKKASAATFMINSALGLSSNIPEHYASGGIVPGPLGSARLAVVHGGESVIPAGAGGGDVHQTIYGGVNVFGATNLQDLLASLVP